MGTLQTRICLLRDNGPVPFVPVAIDCPRLPSRLPCLSIERLKTSRRVLVYVSLLPLIGTRPGRSQEIGVAHYPAISEIPLIDRRKLRPVVFPPPPPVWGKSASRWLSRSVCNSAAAGANDWILNATGDERGRQRGRGNNRRERQYFRSPFVLIGFPTVSLVIPRQ